MLARGVEAGVGGKNPKKVLFIGLPWDASVFDQSVVAGVDVGGDEKELA